MIVIDASALIEWLLRTRTGLRVEARLFAAPTRLHVPQLLDVEIVQVLRRQVREDMLTAVRAEEALDATLLTCDSQIASAPGHHARVDVI